ncbi:MAG TPA: hypothetical protein VK039_07905 [Brevibacterium sp.]|nr:hypothetical protein [Brevibacterium sp.]
MANQNQESRVERATVALTPTEKRALQFVANVRRTTEADLLREVIPGIVAEYERLMDRLRDDNLDADRGAA